MTFDLIITLYNEKDPVRAGELIRCLEYNRLHPMIRNVHVFYDTSKDGGGMPVLEHLRGIDAIIQQIPSRPTFSQIFEYANNKLPYQKVIFCNADIYFNSSLERLSAVDLTGIFIVLTRWDDNGPHGLDMLKIPGRGLPNFFSSDAWIFSTPFEMNFYADYEPGTMFSDSFLNTQLFKSGRRVYNPCYDVQACHLQQSVSVSDTYETLEGKEEKHRIYQDEQLRNGGENPVSGVAGGFVSDIQYELNNQLRFAFTNFIIDLGEQQVGYDETLIVKMQESLLGKHVNVWFLDKRHHKENHQYLKKLNDPRFMVIDSFTPSGKTEILNEHTHIGHVFKDRHDLFIPFGRTELLLDKL